MQSLSGSEGGEQLEIIADYGCEVGENPLWHPMENKLYWTDIPKGRLFRFDPADGLHEQCYEGRPIGGFTVQADGALLLFMDRGSIAIWRDGSSPEVIRDIPAERSSIFNDVIADPRGRVFCGTLPDGERKGKLYRLDVDGSYQVVVENVGCSNGMAFTSDRKGFYYTDSFAREIYLFDYSEEDGSIGNRRVFARFNEEDGLPDGITVDTDGRVWSALWDGGCVVRLYPDGQVEKKIRLPTRKISSLTFGGEACADIYITTAGGNTKEGDGLLAGAVFRLRGQGCGSPEFLSRVEPGDVQT